MKISEAILLGSTMIRWLARTTLTDDREAGCALGMMMVASGDTRLQAFPLLASKIQMPCGCYDRPESLAGVIAHIFDSHVMGTISSLDPEGRQPGGRWTMEMLVEWVAKIEREAEGVKSPFVPAVGKVASQPVPQPPVYRRRSAMVTFVPFVNPCAYIGLDMEATVSYEPLDPALTPV